MSVRGFQINRCLHDTLALSMVNIFEHFACVCTKINISFIILESTGTQQVSLDLTKILFHMRVVYCLVTTGTVKRTNLASIKKKKDCF